MNSIAEELAELLAEIQRPGDFYASGTEEMFAPSLEVQGVGPVALPLLPAQAEQLAAAAERAPYGQGERTLVDTEVRRTWQIGPERVAIEGRGWARTLDRIVQRACDGLGVDGPVAAQFYKLLLYEQGGFFRSHRDSEKVSGMFGTLIVLLPSAHSGGELAIRHEGREVVLNPRGTDPSEAGFAAFYADCLHEVQPVTEGWRLALVYNLTRPKGKARPMPPNYAKERDRLSALLRRWSQATEDDDEDFPEKLVYPLEHSYTTASLAFDGLKGADAAKAATLTAAAKASECDLHLAIVSIEESGAAEYAGARGRLVPAHWDSGERSETLSDWIPAEETGLRLGTLPIEEGEMAPPNAFEGLKPDSVSFHEATGNEGASFERSYRRAALVLWPKRRRLAVVDQGGLAATLPSLAALTEQFAASGCDRTATAWATAHELAGYMIASWTDGLSSVSKSASHASAMLDLLRRLDDRERIEDFLETVCARRSFDKSDAAATARALALLSGPRAGELARRIVDSNASRAPQACAELLDRVASSGIGMGDLLLAASALAAALPGDPARTDDTPYWLRSKIDAKSVVAVLRTLCRIDGALAGAAVDHCLRWPKVYDFDEVLVPAALELASAPIEAAIERLRAACRSHLARRIAEDLTPPADWTRDSKVTCKCTFCAQLSKFLADPDREVWMLPSLQQNRSHVEQVVREHRCDVETATLRKGSPHTLVCTKNQATFNRRAAQRAKDLKAMERLAELAGTTGPRTANPSLLA